MVVLVNLTDGKIGSRARFMREQAGLTRETLAARSEVSTSTIARLELNGRVPGMAAVVRIADVLDVPVSEFIGERVS